MVAPFTYLGTTTKQLSTFDEFGINYKYFYEYKLRWKQAKPFTAQLPYQREMHWVASRMKSNSNASVLTDAVTPIRFGDVNWTNVRNQSYERLRSAIYDKVGLGVDAAEYRQSVDMIASTVTTLFKTARAIKHLQFGTAMDLLRLKFMPRGVNPLKSFGNNFLEFHFGWQPLLGDIHEALKVINDPVKCLVFNRGRSSEKFKTSGGQDFGSVVLDWKAEGLLRCQQGATVRAVNPGIAHTLDQWGIGNPLSLAWELVPFSFVADWFVNVGDYLDSLSDFANMVLEDTYQSLNYNIAYSEVAVTKAGVANPWTSGTSIQYTTLSRATSLSGIAISPKRLRLPSVTRGATAASLLSTALKDWDSGVKRLRVRA